jgi:hypothetical protein
VASSTFVLDVDWFKRWKKEKNPAGKKKRIPRKKKGFHDGSWRGDLTVRVPQRLPGLPVLPEKDVPLDEAAALVDLG